MEKKLNDLKTQMEEKRKELENSISNDLPYSKILSISKELDDIIAQYIKYTDNNLKNEIITLMKEDLKEIFNITNEKELEHASNNLFTMCYLKINNISDQEIASQIMNGDKEFYKEIQNQDLSIDSKNVPTEEYIKLVDKYKKIIKERI